MCRSFLRLLSVLLVGVSPAAAQVLQLAELTAEQIRALDRSTTVLVVPGGLLEAHGPHLPVFSDGYMNEVFADSLAAAVARRSGWTAVMFPMVPLGAGGANEIGGHHVWPGTYAVRSGTLRTLFMDLATEFGEQGFEWVFIVHGHGSPWHHRALDQAGDYFRDTYGGRMVNLMGIDPDWEGLARDRAEFASPEVLAEDAYSGHAGLSETSRILYLRPDLVSAALADVPSITASEQEMVGVARYPEWPGYFGAPRHATAALGRAELEAMQRAWTDIALSILDGADERAMERYADTMLSIPPIRAMRDEVARYDSTVTARQEAWLREHERE